MRQSRRAVNIALEDTLSSAAKSAEASMLIQEAELITNTLRAELSKFSDMPQPAQGAIVRAISLAFDQVVRRNATIDLTTWQAIARQRLFGGAEPGQRHLSDLAAKAERAGPEYAEAALVLRHIENVMRTNKVNDSGRWLLAKGTVLTIIFFIALVLWAVFLDYRNHSLLWEKARSEISSAPEGALERLAILSTLHEQMESEVAAFPLGVMRHFQNVNAAERVREVYTTETQKLLPQLLQSSLDSVLALEAEPLDSYDNWRASVAMNEMGQNGRAYLQSWLLDRAESLAHAKDVSLHLGAFPVEQKIVYEPKDAELMAQAKLFAQEADEAARAALELRRSAAARALPVLDLTAEIPGIETIFQHKSHDFTLEGLITQRGWEMAENGGAGSAILTTRHYMAALTERSTDNLATPDDVLFNLTEYTLNSWRNFLAELRVPAFRDTRHAVDITAQLAQDPSIIARLIETVWYEVGGADRNRPRNVQLLIVAQFGPMIAYLESGRVSEISDVFARLHYVLARDERKADAELMRGRLLDVTGQAQSIRSLSRAPTLIAALVEDVLAQSAALHSAAMDNSIAQRWQREVRPACEALLGHAFPFGAGPDAKIEDVAFLFGPQGLIAELEYALAEQGLERKNHPWRWSAQARFNGFKPESAAFFEEAAAIRAALFDGASMGASFTVTTLAAKGQGELQLGGQQAILGAGQQGVEMHWPGPEPNKGIVLDLGETNEPLRHSGVWGLYHLAANARLRSRDGGRRILVDLRRDGERVFASFMFKSELNPFSLSASLRNLRCPDRL